MVDRDLREWIEQADKISELKRINSADWNVEIGAVTELGIIAVSKATHCSSTILRVIRGYRLLSNTMNTVNRIAMTLQMEPAHNRLDFVKKTSGTSPCQVHQTASRQKWPCNGKRL